MSIHEIIREYTVKVNDGSGALVHCLSEEYSYILTAKHNLKKKNNVETWEGEGINVLDVYQHVDDCALLKIPFVDGLPLVRYKNTELDYQAGAVFGGFPGHRAGEKTAEERFKSYDGKAKQFDSGFYLTIEGLPGKPLIDGASGGGVYLVSGKQPYLIGIEIGMAGPQPNEPGVVLCYDLSRFDEIVKTNNLSPILPSFLSCFNKIRLSTFNYTLNSQKILQDLQGQLHSKANRLVRDGMPKPYELLALYEKGLIVNGQADNAIYDLELWSAYSEFLILHSILNDIPVMDLKCIQEMERTNRFVYSRSKEAWLQDLNNILSSARKLLNDGGLLVVSSGDIESPPIPNKEFIKYLVENIAVPAAEYDHNDGGRIDMGLEGGDIPFGFALLGSLHRECITKNEYSFAGLNGSEIMKLLKDKYANEFNKCK
jgi:hypothetical protein